MQKILISLLVGTLLILGGCSSWKDFSLVHIPDIQQGNIVTPEVVAELKPGMSRRQVRFLLGTPLLVDVFHQNRWDYLFSIKRRNDPLEIKHFSVFFDGDSMIRYSGDIKPAENLAEEKEKKELVVSVPDYTGELGIVDKALQKAGLDIEDD